MPRLEQASQPSRSPATISSHPLNIPNKFMEATPKKKPARRTTRADSGRRRRIQSLAVLPLENQSADPNTEYLSDGITETVITALSQLPRLNVMSRSAVFRYKESELDALEIRRELGVRAMLAGRVLQLGDALRISLELVDVDNGFQLWGANYNRKLVDIFAVQDEIASEVSERLKLKLSGEERKRLRKRPTKDLEAYQEYLRGRHAWNRRTVDSLKKSMFFSKKRSKRIRPTPSYVGLADAYAILGMAEYGAVAPPDIMPKAKAAAERGVELDPSVGGQAQTTLAHIQAFFDWDWEGAEKGFLKAVESDPRYPFSRLLISGMRCCSLR